MNYNILGRTGLKVSVAGLGCGGPSRLGLSGLKGQTHSESEVVAHVRGAIDLGINFFDTAEWYGTEVVVGKAIAGVPRDRLVISTKKNLVPEDHADPDKEIRRSVEQSLKNLGTDYVDVYHVHGAEPKDYAECLGTAYADDVAAARGGQAAFHRHHRTLRRRFRSCDGRARRARQLLGCRHGGI